MLQRRKSGILLHITSLPSPYGTGDLGSGAYWFIDFLYHTGQGVWQILPLCPTSTGSGNSPYSSHSAFAGNPLLISPQDLKEDGYVSGEDIEQSTSLAGFNNFNFNESKVDYHRAGIFKKNLLNKAYLNIKSELSRMEQFKIFCEKNFFWLEDYALFEALKRKFGDILWSRWPEKFRDKEKTEIESFKRKNFDELQKEKFIQFLFFSQWEKIKYKCDEKKVQIMGDLPLYVSYDSADVWAHPHIFKLNRDKKPVSVSGAPPDYFSKTGQLWNNPIYRWDFLKKTGYRWWLERMKHNFRLFHLVRLDHFRGFSGFWEVPAGEKTAQNGKWVEGPGEDFFNTILSHIPFLPVIAEDLGEITPDVLILRDRFGFPGMRVMQFAFNDDASSKQYLPHNFVKNCVAYTGTHDNNTLMGWFFDEKVKSKADERRRALNYIGKKKANRKSLNWDFIRLLMMSQARLVIFPMQDILGLGSEGRMNLPGSAIHNWRWRISTSQIDENLQQKLKEITLIYERSTLNC